MNRDMQLSIKKRIPHEKNPKTSFNSPLDAMMKDLLSDSDESDDDYDGNGNRNLLTSSSSSCSTSLLLLCAEACQLKILFEIIISLPSHYYLHDISTSMTSSPPHPHPHHTHYSSHKDVPQILPSQHIFMSSNLVEIMKEMLNSKFFWNSTKKWKQFLTRMKGIDFNYSQECLQRMTSHSCCEQLTSLMEYFPSEMSNTNDCSNTSQNHQIENCSKMIENIDLIISYLRHVTTVSNTSSPPVGGGHITAITDDSLTSMLTTVSTSIICLYALTVSVAFENEFTTSSSHHHRLSDRIASQILDLLSLPMACSQYLIISLSLFLECHPPSSSSSPSPSLFSHLENEIIQQQSRFLAKFLTTTTTSSSSPSSSSQSLMLQQQSLRDNLLCHFAQSSSRSISFLFIFLINIILPLPSSPSLPSSEEDHISLSSYQTISLQLFGLILGVAQSDLDEIFIRSSRIHLNKLHKQREGEGEREKEAGGKEVEDIQQLSEWMILFPYLKILCWRLMGATSSPKTDTEECLNNFTNKLEVLSLLPTLPHSLL
jgi:hypothetical protein